MGEGRAATSAMFCSAVRIFCLSQQLPVRRLVVGVGAELEVAVSLVGTLWPVATSSPGDGQQR